MKIKPKGGVSLCDGIFLVFLLLKLGHQIDWSWWFVILPELWVIFISLLVEIAENAKKLVQQAQEFTSMKLHFGVFNWSKFKARSATRCGWKRG